MQMEPSTLKQSNSAENAFLTTSNLNHQRSSIYWSPRVAMTVFITSFMENYLAKAMKQSSQLLMTSFLNP